MTIARSLDWIHQIESSLAGLDEKPQFATPAPLDWDLIEKDLRDLFQQKNAKLTHEVKGWMTAEQSLAGLVGQPLPLAIMWSPIQAPAFFATDQQNLKALMAYLFQLDATSTFFSDAAYVQGFYNYFAAQMLSLLEQQQFAAPLTPRLGPEFDNLREMIDQEACFVIDLSLKLGKQHFWGRILLSESFQSEWKSYFAHLSPPPLSEEMKEKLTVDLSLEVAHARLNLEEWQKIRSGDFIVLDQCWYDPAEHKGAVVLTLNQKPIFRGRIKDEGIKITNYPIYEEVSDTMEENPFRHKFEENEEDNLYGDLNEDEDSEFDEEDEDLFADLEPRHEPLEPEAEESPSAIAAALAPEEQVQTPPISPSEIPVNLTIEVGRVRMTAGALMNLTPGNLLELNVSPEQGVDLVINGKKVGRGELIRIGDVLGVRIITL